MTIFSEAWGFFAFLLWTTWLFREAASCGVKTSFFRFVHWFFLGIVALFGCWMPRKNDSWFLFRVRAGCGAVAPGWAAETGWDCFFAILRPSGRWGLGAAHLLCLLFKDHQCLLYDFFSFLSILFQGPAGVGWYRILAFFLIWFAFTSLIQPFFLSEFHCVCVGLRSSSCHLTNESGLIEFVVVGAGWPVWLRLCFGWCWDTWLR